MMQGGLIKSGLNDALNGVNDVNWVNDASESDSSKDIDATESGSVV
jgi:hypothetical protein